MENNETNSNWTPPAGGQGGGNELPGAKGSFTLGLIGLILSPICCCGISGAGLVLSILGFVKSGKAIKEYEANPGNYDEAMLKKAKTAKILSTIGLIIGGICFILFLVGLAMNGVKGSMDFERMMRRMK